MEKALSPEKGLRALEKNGRSYGGADEEYVAPSATDTVSKNASAHRLTYRAKEGRQQKLVGGGCGWMELLRRGAFHKLNSSESC